MKYIKEYDIQKKEQVIRLSKEPIILTINNNDYGWWYYDKKMKFELISLLKV